MRGPSWVGLDCVMLVIDKFVHNSFGDRAEIDVAGCEKREGGSEESQRWKKRWKLDADGEGAARLYRRQVRSPAWQLMPEALTSTFVVNNPTEEFVCPFRGNQL